MVRREPSLILLYGAYRHCVVLYNAEARAEDPTELGIQLSPRVPSEPLSGAGSLLKGLKFDEEVVFKTGQVNLILGPTASGKVGS